MPSGLLSLSWTFLWRRLSYWENGRSSRVQTCEVDLSGAMFGLGGDYVPPLSNGLYRYSFYYVSNLIFPPIVWKGAIFLTSDKQWLLLSNISLSKFPLQHCVVSSYAWDEDSADTRECFHTSRLHSMPPSLLWLSFLETLAIWSFWLLPPSPCPRESPSLCLGFHFRTRASLTSFGSHLAWISVIPWPENQLMKVLVSYNLPFLKIISVC